MKIIKLFLIAFFFFIYPLSATQNDASKTIYTDEELQWIQNNPTIRVASELDWPPFDFVKDGEAKGFAIDHIKLVAKKAGLNIEFVNGHSWAELLTLFKAKKIDVMPVMYKNQQRKEYTLFSQAYYRGKLGIITRKDTEISKNDLVNIKVGMEKLNGSINIVEKQIPNIKIHEIESNYDLVRSLATKKLDAIIGNPLLFYYIAKEEQITNLAISNYIEMDTTQQLNTSFHIGVRNDAPILYQIIEKAMLQLDDGEYIELEKKWTSVNITGKIDWILVFQILGVLLVVFILLMFNNIKLKSMVAQKTEELRELNKELELKVHQRTKELIEVNKELEYRANTDALTKIPNRRYFYEMAQKIFNLVQRNQSTLSIAMIDIDNFKRVNDTFGHDVGDQVIQALGSEIYKSIRKSDICARHGGEEFIILFPDTDMRSALVVCEKLRETVENYDELKETSFTVSIGIAELQDSDKEISSVVIRADKFLYKAKESGKNRLEY